MPLSPCFSITLYMQELQRLDEKTTHFEANGVRYVVHRGLTLEGFQILEVLRIEIECGNSAADLLKLNGKIVEALQKNDVYGASVAAYNATNIAERINDGRQPAWLLALTLFVRPEGADVRKWEEAEAEQWIQDWNEAGYSVADLFTLVFACRQRLDFDFLRSFQDISGQPGESESAQPNEQAKAEPNAEMVN